VVARLDAALALPPAAELWAPLGPNAAQQLILQQLGKEPNEAAWLELLLTKEKQTARKNVLTKAQSTQVAPDVAQHLSAAAQHAERILKARKAWRGRQITEALLVWAAQVQAHYQAAKHARGVVDFADLLKHLKHVLGQRDEALTAWLWHRLDTRYRHLVVDEAQDNNAAQSQIVQVLAQNLLAGDVGGGTRTVLAVGDVKQSIYRFQGAQPQWFLQLRGLLEAWANPAVTVQLTYTFRNSPAILDVVNAAFAPEPIAQTVQAEAAPWPTHTSVFTTRPGRVELWPLEPAKVGEDNPCAAAAVTEQDAPCTSAATPPRWLLAEERVALAQPSAKLRALQKVAVWLKAQHAAGVVLPSTGKPLTWADVLVVVQRNGTGQLLAALLKRQGIPVATGTGQAPLVVRDGVALVRFFYNPHDNLALAQVLKGLCGFTDAQLLAVAQQATEGPDEVAWVQALGTDDPRGICAFKASLPPVYGPAALVQQMVGWWGLNLADFAPLLAWAEAAEMAPIPHLGPLGTLVARLEAEDLPAAPATGNGVQILTVHRAKGLEAPLVILPETTRRMHDVQDALLWGTEVMLFKQGQSISALEDELIATEAEKCYSDGLRGLYVGLTRATDWLVVTGWEQGKKKNPPPEA
jgi:ATP-dependent helicase/nuclease subunit A